MLFLCYDFYISHIIFFPSIHLSLIAIIETEQRYSPTSKITKISMQKSYKRFFSKRTKIINVQLTKNKKKNEQ